jgi:hypothetical protein
MWKCSTDKLPLQREYHSLRSFPSQSPDDHVAKRTGCLPAIGYAFRRGGRASNLACPGTVQVPLFPVFLYGDSHQFVNIVNYVPYPQ